MTAFVWRESVYKNDFRCSHCGAKLFDVEAEQPTDFLGVDPEQPENCHCMKCKTLVAVLREYDGEATGPLMGLWKGGNEL